MRRYQDDPDNMYILIQVGGVENLEPAVKFMPNPWGLYIGGILDFKSEGGYAVYAKE